MYLIILSGLGDVTIKIVNEMTWKWVTHHDQGRLPLDDHFRWVDQTIPDEVKKELWLKESNKACYLHNYTKFDVKLSIGSWKNDRAVIAPAITIDSEEALFGTFKEMDRFLKKHNMKIISEYEGGAY
jgi:hypothetical protein